ncbi:Iron-sulphur cluster assembly protein [gamma proteobacterium HdN1]|nr:Iron-sulphur cluster assembly protein [gamma proteobacterium HdN1]
MSVQTFAPSVGLSFTPNAIAHLRKILQSNTAQGVRVSVKMSGCSGYRYVLDCADQPKENDLSLEVASGLIVFIDPESLPMLAGTEVDYVREGLNSSLQFRNPNATGECGCGESFTVK